MATNFLNLNKTEILLFGHMSAISSLIPALGLLTPYILDQTARTLGFYLIYILNLISKYEQ